jgi:predicted RNA polymerase sigma factor
VRRNRQADAEFEALFRAQFGVLVESLTVAAGSRDAATDAVQDAFLQAHRQWDRIGSYDKPAAWVRRET